MTFPKLTAAILCGATLLLASGGRADEPAKAAKDELTEFTSKEGRFSVRLPGKPEHEKTTVGKANEEHHMFTVPSAQGVYLISYQDNPNLEDAKDEAKTAALESGRDAILKGFAGELIESKETKLDKKHPGLSFRMKMPAVGGEARCRFYMVGTRLYQAMALGTPEFVASDRSTQVLDSFKLAK